MAETRLHPTYDAVRIKTGPQFWVKEKPMDLVAGLKRDAADDRRPCAHRRAQLSIGVSPRPPHSDQEPS